MSSTAASAGFAYVLGIFGRDWQTVLPRGRYRRIQKKLAQANLDDLLKSNPDNIAIGNANVKVLK